MRFGVDRARPGPGAATGVALTNASVGRRRRSRTSRRRRRRARRRRRLPPRSCRRSRSRPRGRRPGPGARAGSPSRRRTHGSDPGRASPPAASGRARHAGRRQPPRGRPGSCAGDRGRGSGRRTPRAPTDRGAGCAHPTGTAGTAGRRCRPAPRRPRATRSAKSTPGASASRNQRRLPAADSITDIMCQRAGHGVAEGMDATARLVQRPVGRGEHDARRPERQRHRPRRHDPDADRVGRLVAAAGHDRGAGTQPGRGGRHRRDSAGHLGSLAGRRQPAPDRFRARPRPRRTSRGRPGRTAASRRRRPCRARDRRSTGAAGSPWAAGRGRSAARCPVRGRGPRRASAR